MPKRIPHDNRNEQIAQDVNSDWDGGNKENLTFKYQDFLRPQRITLALTKIFVEISDMLNRKELPILLSTGSLIGEGFELPDYHVLFLQYPSLLRAD